MTGAFFGSPALDASQRLRRIEVRRKCLRHVLSVRTRRGFGVKKNQSRRAQYERRRLVAVSRCCVPSDLRARTRRRFPYYVKPRRIETVFLLLRIFVDSDWAVGRCEITELCHQPSLVPAPIEPGTTNAAAQ